MNKQQKTNASRLVEQKKIEFEFLSYKPEEKDAIDGISVSKKIGYPCEVVYKTLVATTGKKQQYYVFVIPVTGELDLKKAAKVVGEKKIEMIAVKELFGLTGYVRGGCSPIGMKKQFPTYIDVSAEKFEFMIISGGKIGTQLKLAPYDLLQVCRAKFADVIY